ncbi:MAG TPA: hypothetical protein VJJ83_03140 [Candidatus Babeliales bacterium]|nr:hypothetical protein [Candidatus Babeliales bacterium]
MKLIERLSPTTKGLLAVAIGAILLLDRFNFFHEVLKNLVVLGAIALIVYGLFLGNFISKLINKLRGKSASAGPETER